MEVSTTVQAGSVTLQFPACLSETDMEDINEWLEYVKKKMERLKMAKFKAGDVVKLKSSSPDMTVNSYQTDGNRVNCTWFVGDELKNASFGEEQLELVPPKTKIEAIYSQE